MTDTRTSPVSETMVEAGAKAAAEAAGFCWENCAQGQWRREMRAGLNAALSAGPAQTPAMQPDGINGCMAVAATALDYLADHERPIGGQQKYNAEHLMQIASELRGTSAALSQSSTERTEFNGNVDYGGEKPRRSRRGGEK